MFINDRDSKTKDCSGAWLFEEEWDTDSRTADDIEETQIHSDPKGNKATEELPDTTKEPAARRQKIAPKRNSSPLEKQGQAISFLMGPRQSKYTKS